MPRPTKTFLVEAGNQHFRVDLNRIAGAYSVAGVYRDETSAASGGFASDGLDAFDPMGGAMETEWMAPLLKRRPKPAAEITVLSDRITAVVAEIPASPGEDWRSSAEMEAQTISGLSSSESVVSSTLLPAESGMVCAWVAQVAMRDVASLRTAVTGVKGCRLISVGHPGGIHLDTARPQLESWTDFVLFHSAGERIELRGWNGPDALIEAREDGATISALIEAGDDAVFVSSASDPSIEEFGVIQTIDLTDLDGVKAWSKALARSCDPLTGQIMGMPLVAVPKPPPSSAELAVKSGLIAMAAIALLGGHYFLNSLNKAKLEADVATLEDPAKRVASARERIKELNRELKELNDAEGEFGESDVNVYAHRRRIGALLDGIAVGAEVPGVVVLEFRPDELETVITGAATSFNAPQALARRIDEALAANGWRAALTRRTAKLLQPDGGPWSYEIRLNPGRPVSVDGPFGESEAGVTAGVGNSDRSNDDGDTAITF